MRQQGTTQSNRHTLYQAFLQCECTVVMITAASYAESGQLWTVWRSLCLRVCPPHHAAFYFLPQCIIFCMNAQFKYCGLNHLIIHSFTVPVSSHPGHMDLPEPIQALFELKARVQPRRVTKAMTYDV